MSHPLQLALCHNSLAFEFAGKSSAVEVDCCLLFSELKPFLKKKLETDNEQIVILHDSTLITEEFTVGDLGAIEARWIEIRETGRSPSVTQWFAFPLEFTLSQAEPEVKPR
jgi:hypothetical protein